MKSIIFATVLIFVVVGCGAQDDGREENNENTSVVEKQETNINEDIVIDNIEQNEQNKNLIEDGDVKKTEDEKILRNKAADSESKTESIDECDDGYVYNTVLDKCFKLGESNNETEQKIDPVVKECNDKGGIYNAQAKKCFID